ncbi:hypothetical protein K435DRAFT_896797 [Dendrothele bispora CBS 962.96]|uniref:Uncharacterized protein n=1 Tax=Dendrothele bispora (strain CBS 962.96) TaxID=1314807 RepID=A0A4S8M005_DENBC|nr:hypothetical protein K435DRAFT_896797 [Dendrothele bispora CBS 962.96]
MEAPVNGVEMEGPATGMELEGLAGAETEGLPSAETEGLAGAIAEGPAGVEMEGLVGVEAAGPTDMEVGLVCIDMEGPGTEMATRGLSTDARLAVSGLSAFEPVGSKDIGSTFGLRPLELSALVSQASIGCFGATKISFSRCLQGGRKLEKHSNSSGTYLTTLKIDLVCFVKFKPLTITREKGPWKYTDWQKSEYHASCINDDEHRPPAARVLSCSSCSHSYYSVIHFHQDITLKYKPELRSFVLNFKPTLVLSPHPFHYDLCRESRERVTVSLELLLCLEEKLQA